MTAGIGPAYAQLRLQVTDRLLAAKAGLMGLEIDAKGLGIPFFDQALWIGPR